MCSAWVGHKTHFSGRGSINAAENPLPNILQLNTEGLTAEKISVIEQLAYKNKAFIIVLQETHCTTADKLVIPNFSLAGSVLSRNYGRGTFVHERLKWSLVDQSPELSDTEWLCVDVAGYRSLTSTNLHAHDSHQWPSRRSHTPVCMLVTSTANMSTGVTPTCQLGYTLTVKAWTPGQHPTTFDCCMTQRKQPVSPLPDGKPAPTRTWPSRVSARTADCRTNVF